MPIRKTLAVLALAGFAGLASAAEPRSYSQSEFDRLARGGKPVVVDVTASWCPTCKAQKPIIDALSKRPAYNDVAVLTVDFDTEKTILREFKVVRQSTLIAFRGGKETGRSIGDTTADRIEGIFRKAAR